jgi:hypothetical protein
MTKEFLPYDRSLKLKQLGFDESCFGYYSKGVLSIEIIKSGKIFTNEDSIYFDKDSSCLAPTFSQAFRWFREKYDLPSWTYESEGKWFWKIVKGDFWEQDQKPYTFEEAELACIDKLSELIDTLLASGIIKKV